MANVNVNELAGHVLNTCLENGIKIDLSEMRLEKEGGFNFAAIGVEGRGGEIFRAICIRPITSELAYAKAMHEIGHHLNNPDQTRPLIELETQAWEWAARNAILWGDKARGICRYALGSYLEGIAKGNRFLLPNGRSKAIGPAPGPGHILWKLYATGGL